MVNRNGKSVFDIVTNGWRRTVTKFGGEGGSLMVNIPKEFTDDIDISEGDDVAIQRPDGKEKVLEYHFGDE